LQKDSRIDWCIAAFSIGVLAAGKHSRLFAITIVLTSPAAAIIAAGAGISASGHQHPRSLVPRRGFLIGDVSGRLRVLSRRGKVIHRVPRSVAPYGPQGMALAPDRRHAFVSVERGDRLPALYRVSLATGARRLIANAISPVMSSHGTRLAYVAVVRRRDIHYKAALVVRNLRTGGKQRIPLGPDMPRPTGGGRSRAGLNEEWPKTREQRAALPTHYLFGAIRLVGRGGRS
jgi:hypothetical protein